jgi:hypothetical protein
LGLVIGRRRQRPILVLQPPGRPRPRGRGVIPDVVRIDPTGPKGAEHHAIETLR